jgi:hypothetical protein
MPINPPSSHPVVHSSKHVALWVHQKSSENSCPNVHGRRRNSSTHPNEKSLLKDGCGNLYIIRGTLTVQAEWGANLKWRDEGQEVRRMFSSIHLLLPEFYVVLAAALFFNTWKQQKKNQRKEGGLIQYNMILTSLSACRAPCLLDWFRVMLVFPG